MKVHAPRQPRPRRTNLALLLALCIAFVTGVGTVAAGTPSARWVVITHGLAGMMVVLLTPWKSIVIRRGLRRARTGRRISLLLAILVTTALVTGIGYATGAIQSVAGTRGMWIHIAAALAATPIIIWHVAVRPARPHKADLTRRALLRTGGLVAVAGGLYFATNTLVRAAGLSGSRRRFTGSYEAGSFDPHSMPTTSWLNDSAPNVDGDKWRLSIADADGRRELGLTDLLSAGHVVRATLDCTSGWYSHQDWNCVPLSSLIHNTDQGRSLRVTSSTGYWLRFPVADLDRLFIATGIGGERLSVDHGYPARLVAPGRRGFWRVKWLERIEVQETPWWWQPPFPIS